MSEHKRQVRTELTADQKARKQDESNLADTGRDAEVELAAEELEERIAPVKAW
jgi:5'-3' exonuclease